MIEPLSWGTLEEAKKLVNRVFPAQEDYERSDRWLPYSLEQKEAAEKTTSGYVRSAGYWVYLKDGRVVGIVGLYEYGRSTKTVSWLGWFCVDPDFRRQGIGSELLDYAISKAKEAGKKYLRIYTTTDPNEAEAQKLYEKYGFKIVKKNAGKRGKYTIFHRELKLS